MAAIDTATSNFDLGQQGRTSNHLVWRQFRRHHGGLIGACLLAIIVFMSVAAPLITPFDPTQASVPDRVKPPSAHFLMGTDQLGRDVFTRILYGGRISLTIGLLSVSISFMIGTSLGLISGFYGGIVDTVIQRLVDIAMAIPGILLALAIIAGLGVGIVQVMIAVGISQAPGWSRVVRGSVLSAREESYVEAARVTGRTDVGIMFRHILPNVMAPIIVLATLGVAWAILTTASLSFLGLGAQPPSPEWGAIISAGRNILRTAWWVSTFPGIVMTITIIAINMVGDAVRDAMDPRLRSR